LVIKPKKSPPKFLAKDVQVTQYKLLSKCSSDSHRPFVNGIEASRLYGDKIVKANSFILTFIPTLAFSENKKSPFA
jgi:hypothetical protein